MWADFKEWVYQTVIGLDLLMNAILGGSAGETMSSRCYRLDHIPTYASLEKFVNALFYPFQGPEHCKHAYEKEILGRLCPQDFFARAFELNIEMDKSKLGPNIVVPK
jgi:hypothetical protein